MEDLLPSEEIPHSNVDRTPLLSQKFAPSYDKNRKITLVCAIGFSILGLSLHPSTQSDTLGCDVFDASRLRLRRLRFPGVEFGCSHSSRCRTRCGYYRRNNKRQAPIVYRRSLPLSHRHRSLPHPHFRNFGWRLQRIYSSCPTRWRDRDGNGRISRQHIGHKCCIGARGAQNNPSLSRDGNRRIFSMVLCSLDLAWLACGFPRIWQMKLVFSVPDA